MHYGRFSRTKNRWVKVDAGQARSTLPTVDADIADELKIKPDDKEGRGEALKKPSIVDDATLPEPAAGVMAH